VGAFCFVFSFPLCGKEGRKYWMPGVRSRTYVCVYVCMYVCKLRGFFIFHFLEACIGYHSLVGEFLFFWWCRLGMAGHVWVRVLEVT